jgi:hypothetical protein
MLPLLTGPVDRRFMLTAALPAFLVCAGLLLLWAYMTGISQALADWKALDGVVQWLRCGAFAVAVAFVSLLLAAAQPKFVELFAGAWPTPLGRAAARFCAAYHRARLRRWKHLSQTGSEHKKIRARRVLSTVYPSPDLPEEVLPTRFGNVLRRCEQYARARYGIRPRSVWPRLQPMLTPQSLIDLAAARTNMILMLTLTVVACVFTVAALAALAFSDREYLPLAVCAATGLAVTLAAHRAATPAAVLYGGHVEVAFDLHRRTLLQHLEIDPPATLHDEIAVWERLAAFWEDGIPFDVPRSPG